MLIDWFTLGAQIINFLILVALLRFFLYKPIVEAMDKREAKIASRLEEAKEKREMADKEAEEYRKKQREMEEKRQEMLTQAQNEAKEQRQQMIEQAREEVNETQEAWQRAVQREKTTFLRRLRDRASEEVFVVVRRTLRDLANAELEQQLVDNFLHEIDTLDEQSQEAIAHGTDHAYELHSAFDLSQAQREKLNTTVQDKFGDIELKFVIESDLICGVALVTENRRIGWNVRDYLQAMQAQLEELLQEQAVQEQAHEDQQ